MERSVPKSGNASENVCPSCRTIGICRIDCQDGCYSRARGEHRAIGYHWRSFRGALDQSVENAFVYGFSSVERTK